MLSPRARGALVALVLLGVGIRLAAPLHATLQPDGARFALLGRSLARGDGYVMPMVRGDGPAVLVPDHNFAPLWPTVLAGVYRLVGYSPAATQWAGALVSVGAIVAVGLATRRLLGGDAAWGASALVAVHPHLAFAGAAGNSEDLSLLLFALTLLCILLSLERPAWMLAAGALAGLAFLARAAAGTLFLVAGLAGLAWRLRHRGARGVREPAYLAGAAIFAATVAAWTWRNVATFWDGDARHLYAAAQASQASADVQQQALAAPLPYAAHLVVETIVLLLLLAPFVLAFAAPLARSLRRGRRSEEATSGLWLATALTFVIAAVMGAAYSMAESYATNPIDHERYALFALVPIAWSALRESPTRREWTRVVVVLSVVALVSVAALASGLETGPAKAARALGERMEPGASVRVDGAHPEYVLAYFIEREPRFERGEATWRLSWDAPGAEGERFAGSLLFPGEARLAGPAR